MDFWISQQCISTNHKWLIISADSLANIASLVNLGFRMPSRGIKHIFNDFNSIQIHKNGDFRRIVWPMTNDGFLFTYSIETMIYFLECSFKWKQKQTNSRIFWNHFIQLPLKMHSSFKFCICLFIGKNLLFHDAFI